MAQRPRNQVRHAVKGDRNRTAIRKAQQSLHSTILGPLYRDTLITECLDDADEPETACVDPAQGIVWVNPFRKQVLTEAEWVFVIAHELLHLGLDHAAKCRGRNPGLWNMACDIATDSFLAAFKIGAPPREIEIDPELARMREDEIYDLLTRPGHALLHHYSFAGNARPDIVSRPPVRYHPRRGLKDDYQKLLAEGIRAAAEQTVRQSARLFGEAAEKNDRAWPPAEAAKRWVMAELPLLGPLAARMTIVADAEMCERMGIGIAAVDPELGEIYFHTRRDLTASDVLFIYVHELLHAGLLHHTRARGRDPHVWNLACDFVVNGWLVEMGVGTLPAVGALYDPSLKGMSAEEIYDILANDPRRCRGLRGFCGSSGDILFDSAGRRIYRGDATMLDDIYRRCMASGLACPAMGRGLVPAGLMEEIRSLFTAPVPWDVELARWIDTHVPLLRDKTRTYARASRRQSSTPDIPRPARYIPQEQREGATFGVVLDTSGSMDRELLGRSLGAIASYAEARDVYAVRLILCDAAPYDRGIVAPDELRGIFSVQGRGGTVLQPAINFLLGRADFPHAAPIMIITDGMCESRITVPREHCFVLPRGSWKAGAMLLHTSAPIFRVLKQENFDA